MMTVVHDLLCIDVHRSCSKQMTTVGQEGKSKIIIIKPSFRLIKIVVSSGEIISVHVKLISRKNIF